MKEPGRRSFFKTGFLGMLGFGALARPDVTRGGDLVPAKGAGVPPKFKLGLVTYELAKDWDVETIIKNCEATGFEGVELRTTHRHGVEPSISKEQRKEVRKRFE